MCVIAAECTRRFYLLVEKIQTHAPTMLTLPSLSGFPRHFTRPARS